MNVQSSISIPFPKKAVEASRLQLLRNKIIAFSKNWKSNLLDYHVKNQNVYYISREDECSTDSFRDFAALDAVKSNWSHQDVVRLRRGATHCDDGTYAKLQDAGVFIETYGAGDHPIIKTGDKYIEVVTSAWM